MMAGRDGLHEGHHLDGEGGGEGFERPPTCSAEQAQAALEVSVAPMVVVVMVVAVAVATAEFLGLTVLCVVCLLL